MGLEEGEDLGEALITELLKVTKNTGTEENPGVTNLVAVLLKLESIQYLLSHNLALYETRWDGVGGKNGVSGEMKNGE